MNTREAIAARRSIRRFNPDPLTREQVQQLLSAAIQAPSGKNLQPWRFIVLQGAAKAELVAILDDAFAALRDRGIPLGSAPASKRIMEQAPVTILLMARPVPEAMKQWEEGMVRVNLQSIGAAIQNLCLAATEAGIGSLWIADVLFGQGAIEERFAGAGETLVAAVALGYADERPDARPRLPLEESVEWRWEGPGS
jgi:nitroreductase